MAAVSGGRRPARATCPGSRCPPAHAWRAPLSRGRGRAVVARQL